MEELQLGLSLCNHQPPKTLPLLSAWNDQHHHHPPPTPFSTSQIYHDEEVNNSNNHPIGWPPIESWRRRRKAVHNHRRPVGHNFVKVKMEGIPIARKMDLTLYHSHNSLKIALISMFSNTYQAIDSNALDFTLIYEDNDGDWLLAQDLPWNSFVECVQRLKILVRKRNKE